MNGTPQPQGTRNISIPQDDTVLKEFCPSPAKYSGVILDKDSPSQLPEPMGLQVNAGTSLKIYKMDDGKEYVAIGVDKKEKDAEGRVMNSPIETRLVPYDDWNARNPLSFSEAVQRFRDDFFNSAESGICVKRTPEQIKQLQAIFEGENLTPEYHRSVGALLVGSMIERMNDIALEVTHVQNVLKKQGVAEEVIANFITEKLPAIKEVGGYTSFLLSNEEALKNTVRTRNYATDRDGRFYELASELAKSFVALNPESALERNHNRAIKIAEAMHGINALGEQMLVLSAQLPEQNSQIGNLKEATTQLIRQFAQTAITRVGIKASDSPAYDLATIQYKAAKDGLKEIYKAARDITVTGDYMHSNTPAAFAIEQLSKGVEMVDDISRLRWDLPESRKHYQEESLKLVPKTTAPQYQVSDARTNGRAVEQAKEQAIQ